MYMYPTRFSDVQVQSEALIITVWQSVATSTPAQRNADENNNENGNDHGTDNNYYMHNYEFACETPLHMLVQNQSRVGVQLLRFEHTCLNESRVLRLKSPLVVPPSVQRVQQSQRPKDPKDFKEAAPLTSTSSSTQSSSFSGLFKGCNRLSWNRSESGSASRSGSFGSRWTGRGKKENSVVIRLRERFSFNELNRTMNTIVLYFNLVGIRSMRAIEESIKHEWLPQIKHHSLDAQMILVGRRKETDSTNSTYPTSIRQEDGIRLAQLIGAVAYLEINSDVPQGDPGLEELVDILAWLTSRSKSYDT